MHGENILSPLTSSEKDILRTLARQVVEIATQPQQQTKKDLWYAHNQLKKTRPLVLIFPENSWEQILGTEKLQITSLFWKQWEWYLRHLIYRHQNFTDDFVIEPVLYINKIIRNSGWGVDLKTAHSNKENGSWAYQPPLKDPKNISKLKTPVIEVDEQATQGIFDVVNDVFVGLLEVKLHCQPPAANIISEATMLRGIQQVMMDMYDRPEWLHELLSFISNSVSKQAEYLEQNGHLTLNNRNHYTDTGGIGYTNQLPQKKYDPKHIKLKDLWGLGVAQELSEVGPQQHEEFAINYQLPLLEKFGLNSYGCCEPLTKKFDLIKGTVPNLRRISISPWCDAESAADALQDKYIYSWKYNPTNIAGVFDPEKIRYDIQEQLYIAKDCILEIILKDTITVENQPERLNQWSRIVMEEIDRIF